MKLSYAWLNEFVDLKDISPEDLKDQLTMKAFEVEEIETIGLTGPVVVGEILEINKHPDADKIRVTQMRVAENGEPTQIVCGAQNIEVGQLVPVCLPGAVVINRKTGEGLPIKQSEIRGVTSNGMLASASELGIATSDVDGIHVLKKPGESSDLKLGQNALELLNLASDQVFHVGTRSNRGDALCVKGMAREVCALTSRKMKESKTKNEQVAKVFAQTSNSDNSNSDFSVKIEGDAAEDCKYFSIVIIKDLKVQPSPTWLANRLTAMGLRPVNNIVDITNYVMLELGQPLHAYDLDKLPAKSIVVRKARDGEKMLCIDGKERQATNEVLAIASGDVAVGYAGIMGGKDSEISESTKNIALEAAWFKPARVRRGSRLLGLSSDSSLRFERGVDLASVNPALERACDLIIDICGTEKSAQALGSPFTAGSDKVENQNKISVRMDRVKKLLEITLESSRAAELLNPLGFMTTVKDAQTLEVISPSYREKDV
jgi:phenylalanyl-tRNA synthetase beta chain